MTAPIVAELVEMVAAVVEPAPRATSEAFWAVAPEPIATALLAFPKAAFPTATVPVMVRVAVPEAPSVPAASPIATLLLPVSPAPACSPAATLPLPTTKSPAW